MSMEMIEWICSALEAEANPPFDEVHLTGGEVTALASLHEIMERFSATGLPLSVTTSGWCRKQGSWREVLDAVPFRKFYVSLDHVDRAANDAIRGPGSWDRAVRAIKDAVDVRDRKGYPEVSVISVVHRHNILALNELSVALRRWRVDRWMPAYLEAAGNYQDLAPTYDDLEKLNVARKCDPTFDRALGGAFVVGHVPPSLIVTGAWPDEVAPTGCSTLGRLLIIHPSGNVYACYASEYEEVGRVYRISGPEFPPYAEMLAKASRTIPDVCGRCPEPVQHSNPLR